ncbi:MAG TPA: hypothetical protein VF676_10530 [Flavobacterium sp.]|jgi:uncharacterized protein YyaL (SSP411 family)
MKVTATRQANLNFRRKVAVPQRIAINAVDNLKKITADFGILQHEKITQLHKKSFHSLCDNALALISACKHYQISADPSFLSMINRYVDFIELCQLPDGSFEHTKSDKNISENRPAILAEAHGYTIWALGYLIAMQPILPSEVTDRAEFVMHKAMLHTEKIYSPRAMALIIKGLYFYNTTANSIAVGSLIKTLADRLAQMFLEGSTKEWQWFDENITLGDSILPEALLCAYLDTNEYVYKDIAKASFDFLLLKTFTEFPSNTNKTRIKPSRKTSDVVNMILALSKFFGYFKENYYLSKINSAYGRFSDHQHYEGMRVA